MAKALATEAGANFISITGSTLTSKVLERCIMIYFIWGLGSFFFFNQQCGFAKSCCTRFMCFESDCKMDRTGGCKVRLDVQQVN